MGSGYIPGKGRIQFCGVSSKQEGHIESLKVAKDQVMFFKLTLHILKLIFHIHVLDSSFIHCKKLAEDKHGLY